MIFAVKMQEYNKGRGHLRRNWTKFGWDKTFTAGDSTPKRRFIPSRIVEVTEEQFNYLTGTDESGLPIVAQPRNSSVPVFKGFKYASRRELVEMAQREADQRASRGSSTTRAMTDLLGPLEPAQAVVEHKPVKKESSAKEDDFEPMNVKKELEEELTDNSKNIDHSEDSGETKAKSRRRSRK